MRANVRKVKTTRGRLMAELERLGFSSLPSQANFILAKPPEGLSAQDCHERLWKERILVRWLDEPRVRQYVRITVGSDDETDKLLEVTRRIVGTGT